MFSKFTANSFSLYILAFSLTFSFKGQAEPLEKIVNFYSSIDIHYCTTGGSCYTSTFGSEKIPLTFGLVDQTYDYWTGSVEFRRTFRDKKYIAKIFIEQWPLNGANKVTVRVEEEGHPETSSKVKFWVRDLHNFVRFDLEGMEMKTEHGVQRAILSFGPEYRSKN